MDDEVLGQTGNEEEVVVENGENNNEVVAGKDLSQAAFDKIYKQMKVNEERSEELAKQLAAAEEGKVNLVDRIKRLETGQGLNDEPVQKVYGNNPNGTVVYPDTEEEWDNLIAAHPTFGTRLHYQFLNDTNKKQSSFDTAKKNSALKVAKDILPDMYKKDTSGNLMLTEDGRPIPDQSSDLYKIYCKIADEQGSVIHTAKDGPELVALKVKAILGTERENELKKQADNELKESESKRKQQVADGQTAPPGHTPPATPKGKVSFNSDDEKAYAESRVASGVFKDLADFCATRDNTTITYGRGNI